MITLRILLAPGRRGRVVDASGRSLPQPVPAPVIGSAEPLRIILLDPSSLDPADPYGFDTGAPLRLTISGDWDPATIPVYATNALERTGIGTYDLADPSGTRTAEALALLGVLAERLCAWELTAYGGDPATEADWAHPLSVVQFDAPLRQRADSLGGDPTEAPAVDLRGPPGAAASIAVGETSTLPSGSPAIVENVGTASGAILNFGIPRGPAGESSDPSASNAETMDVSAFSPPVVGGTFRSIRFRPGQSPLVVTIPGSAAATDSTPQNKARRFAFQLANSNNTAFSIVTSRGTYAIDGSIAIVEGWVVNRKGYTGEFSKGVFITRVGVAL